MRLSCLHIGEGGRIRVTHEGREVAAADLAFRPNLIPMREMAPAWPGRWPGEIPGGVARNAGWM